MKEVINIYRKQKSTVDAYIINMIKNAPQKYIENAPSIFKANSSIQLLYAVNKEYIQISPTICKKGSEKEREGSNKEHYFSKMKLDSKGFYISNPYLHYRTGKASVSIVHKQEEKYYVFDIDLIALLEELKLIEYNSTYENIKKSFYIFGAFLLAAVSVALVAYGGYMFVAILFVKEEVDLLHNIFQSIIAITLGIAIYDLAKQIFENEVLYRRFHNEENKQYKILGRFLISIIIALSIETLMVVFKIALGDYKEMLAAFWLLLGTTLMFVGLAFFYKIVVYQKKGEDDD
ncbi:MAG: DUF1206 domain-containing protein [Campylobacterales bacterium]|nr:DUF1206 domain-containing protein [Campylobacterales bacterium]